MPSQLKSETARINGAKSRGPTSAEGREKSSRNAMRHGFTSASMMVLDCENPDHFHELMETFLDIYQPTNLAEQDLVEEMVAARWRIRRMWTIEANLFNDEVHTQGSKTDSPKPGVHLARAFRGLADDSRSLSLANRYESRLQRIYDRAYSTLRELQSSRQPSPAVPLPIPSPPRTDAPSDTGASSHTDASPRADTSPQQNRDRQGADPAPAATPRPPQPALRNEPTAAATKEVSEDPSNPEPDDNPPSEIQPPKST
jgi:hypothetical protein